MAPNDASRNRKRGRPSNAEVVVDEGRDATSAPPRKRKRQSHVNEEQQTQDNEPIRSRQRRESGKGGIEYRHLTAVSRKIPRQTIDTKWGPLPTNAVDRVGVLLSDVEKLVVMRLQDERRRLQASTAIQMVSRRLQRKLTRGLPFPPGTRPQREEEFDFEKILDSNRELETRLTPMLHSIDLLKAEIEKEGNLLEQETARLEALEADARADTTRRKKDSKKLHFLLPADQGYVKLEEGWTVRLGDTDLGPQLMNTLDNEEDLATVIDQLYNHLDSMQSNLEQVSGIASAMDRSRAVIQDLLYKRVDGKKYQHVVLG